jgi:hypothetical protein
MKKVVLTTNLFVCLAFLAYSQQLDIKQAGDNFTISIKYKDQIAINPPAEGLWSIATSWEDDWPASWQHATPTRLQEFGDWKILSGIMKLPEGEWHLQDAYRQEEGRIKCIRRFEWHGAETLENVTLSVRWKVNAQNV